MKTIGVAKFKEQCLALLDRLDPQGLIITKNGKPVAKVVPIAVESSRLIGRLKGKIKFHGDANTTGVKWDAES